MTYRILGLSAAIAVSFGAMVISSTDSSASPATVVQKECGACHMAYLPQFLPARSWTAVMKGLANHFGENASLDAATSKTITSYLTTHAADAPGQDDRFLRGLSAADTPLRISDTPYWIQRHGEIPAEVFTHPKIKSKANCIACHQNAEKGGFEDE